MLWVPIHSGPSERTLSPFLSLSPHKICGLWKRNESIDHHTHHISFTKMTSAMSTLCTSTHFARTTTCVATMLHFFSSATLNALICWLPFFFFGTNKPQGTHIICIVNAVSWIRFHGMRGVGTFHHSIHQCSRLASGDPPSSTRSSY